MYVCIINVSMYVCTYVYVHVCMYNYVYVCMYVCMYVCIIMCDLYSVHVLSSDLYQLCGCLF